MSSVATITIDKLFIILVICQVFVGKLKVNKSYIALYLIHLMNGTVIAKNDRFRAFQGDIDNANGLLKVINL